MYDPIQERLDTKHYVPSRCKTVEPGADGLSKREGLGRHALSTLMCWLVLATLLLGSAWGSVHAAANSVPQPLSVAPLAGGAGPTDPEEVRRFLEPLFVDALATRGIGNAAFVLVGDGKELFKSGYGYADQAKKQPIDPDRSIYFAASLGKLFVATAVMQLVEQGKLDLDADVNSYLKHFQIEKNYTKPVTLANLLTHTGGFEDSFLGAIMPAGGHISPLGEYLASHLRRAMPPGEQFSYSNYGMALAGYIVEEVSGASFDQYVELHIFTSLGMSLSSFRQPLPTDLLTHLVGYEPGYMPETLIPYPAGSLATTPHDMAQFLIAHLNGGSLGDKHMLGATTERLMQQEHFTPYPGMPGVAYGFFESFMNRQHVLFHTGDRGHHSLLFLLPDHRLGFYLVYSTSSDEQSAAFRELLAQKFMDHYYPTPTKFTLPQPPTGFQQRADRFVGIYRPNQYARSTLEKITVLPQQIQITNPGNGTLQLQLGMGGSNIKLVEVQPLLFRAEDGTYVAFYQDATDQITRLAFATVSISDPGGAERIAWYENGLLQLALVAGGLLIFLSRCIGIILGKPRRYLQRRSQKKEVSPVPRLAGISWWLADVVSILVVISPILLLVWLLTNTRVFGIPPVVSLVLSLLLIASILGVVLVVCAFIAWWRRYWSLATRLYFSLLALTAFGMIPFLNYWNLLGFRW